jgi:hypothetical protein
MGRIEQCASRGVNSRPAAARRGYPFRVGLQRGEQEHGGAVHVGEDVVAIGAPRVVQLAVEGGHQE